MEREFSEACPPPTVKSLRLTRRALEFGEFQEYRQECLCHAEVTPAFLPVQSLRSRAGHDEQSLWAYYPLPVAAYLCGAADWCACPSAVPLVPEPAPAPVVPPLAPDGRPVESVPVEGSVPLFVGEALFGSGSTVFSPLSAWLVRPAPGSELTRVSVRPQPASPTIDTTSAAATAIRQWVDVFISASTRGFTSWLTSRGA